MKKLLLLSLLLTACSPKLTPVPVVEHHTDTCYIHDLQLDSVYFYESERLRPVARGLRLRTLGTDPTRSFSMKNDTLRGSVPIELSLAPDTLVITRIKEHYRYLHDTIRTSHTDTIVKVVEIPCPSWDEGLPRFGSPSVRPAGSRLSRAHRTFRVRGDRGHIPRYIRYPAYAMYALIAALIALIIIKVAL